MRSKIKPLKDLEFRYSKPLGVPWQRCAAALYDAGLIEYVHDDAFRLTGYRETEKMHRIPEEHFKEAIEAAIRAYELINE